VPSKEADIYALGMTVYQVLTGKWPFHPRREMEIIHVVISGERPSKPEITEGTGMTEEVWDLLTVCWKENRSERLGISDVLGRFCDITGERKTIYTAGLQLDLSGSRQSSYLTAPSSLHAPGTDGASPGSFNTAFSSPYVFPDPEEVPKPEDLITATQDAGRSSAVTHKSRIEVPRRIINEAYSKGKKKWKQVKHIIRVGSTFYPNQTR